MSNRKFQMWFALLVVVIIGILVYRVLTVKTRNKESLNAISQIKNTDELLGKDTAQDLIVNKPVIAQYSENEMNEILDVLLPHLFHEDPYIEAKLLFDFKWSCRNNSKLNHKCESVIPRIDQLSGLVSGFQDLKQIPSNSKLGKALKNRMSYDPTQADVFRHQTRSLLKLIINSKNPYLLAFESYLFMYEGVDNGEVLPFSEWLNSQDQEYNRVVLMYSLLKIAHQNESAESIGFVNEMICESNRFVCEQKFEDTYQKLVLPGMQKDVELLISHLAAFAANE